MSTSHKSRKKQSKQSKSRPIATSTISQPVVEDSSSLTALSSFSSKGDLFAYLSLAVDKHRLRIYDPTTGQSVAEHIVDSARVSSLSWHHLSTVVSSTGLPPSKKKRRKSQASEEADSGSTQTVALGLSDGSVLFFSPTHGRVYSTLSHPSSTSAILSLVGGGHSRDGSSNVWTSGADGVIRLWNVHRNEMGGSWKNDDRIPYTSMVLRPLPDDQNPELLVAHHSIRLLSIESDLANQKPKELASFTGHASSIKMLQWDTSASPCRRFVSMAENDRVISLWEIPSDDLTASKMVASVQLDSDARYVSLSTSTSTLLTLAASGKVSVYPIPDELVPPASSNRTQHKIPTLLPRSTLFVSSKGNSSHLVASSFVEGSARSIRVVRIVGGVRPIFNVLDCQDDDGNFIPEVVIPDISLDTMPESRQGIPNKRYTESSAAVGSGVDLGQDEDLDNLDVQNVEGHLDVDIAELSLGQRLTAVSGADDAQGGSDSESSSNKKQKSKSTPDGLSVVPAASLTRTLIQALHSSDSRLMETCLTHSDTTLIRNTVRRLPPQLAVPLITACVERLGRGARAGNMKGGGGGASSQRGTGLLIWVKTVLSVHGGHLMTMPDLVARLSGLHSTLTSRLTLQDSLLSLSGRLDVVLSQIEMRSSTAPAPIALKSGKPSSVARTVEKTHYVEGESEDEDPRMDVEVEVDSGNEDADIEDIELGGSSQGESEEEDDDDEEEDEEEEDDDEDPTMNGFIDDEAEEEFTDEEGDESE
ncbi:WD40-repeat-containing domain protein [Lentinula aff. lateritia]|uniref:WD40-repeat-containing domain protein n=1 Tax=Lentinula aff. lateritia TaxID=2804960 RepID=A0ACC1TUH9_9AGAR|nr:WD40-repeat-containing domain protein [Lentinula aff. lateritia]